MIYDELTFKKALPLGAMPFLNKQGYKFSTFQQSYIGVFRILPIQDMGP